MIPSLSALILAWLMSWLTFHVAASQDFPLFQVGIRSDAEIIVTITASSWPMVIDHSPCLPKRWHGLPFGKMSEKMYFIRTFSLILKIIVTKLWWHAAAQVVWSALWRLSWNGLTKRSCEEGPGEGPHWQHHQQHHQHHQLLEYDPQAIKHTIHWC